jgi:hypothetical protein
MTGMGQTTALLPGFGEVQQVHASQTTIHGSTPSEERLRRKGGEAGIELDAYPEVSCRLVGFRLEGGA